MGRPFGQALVGVSMAAVALGTCAVPASAVATSVPGSSCYVSNPKSIFYVPWTNGGKGTGCYSMDQSGLVYQKTEGSSSAPTQIQQGFTADYFYNGYWQTSTIRRICVVKGSKGYYDSYVLGSGWNGWTQTSNLNSACPDS